jgi:hypothetical protein
MSQGLMFRVHEYEMAAGMAGATGGAWEGVVLAPPARGAGAAPPAPAAPPPPSPPRSPAPAFSAVARSPSQLQLLPPLALIAPVEGGEGEGTGTARRAELLREEADLWAWRSVQRLLRHVVPLVGAVIALAFTGVLISLSGLPIGEQVPVVLGAGVAAYVAIAVCQCQRRRCRQRASRGLAARRASAVRIRLPPELDAAGSPRAAPAAAAAAPAPPATGGAASAP